MLTARDILDRLTADPGLGVLARQPDGVFTGSLSATATGSPFADSRDGDTVIVLSGVDGVNAATAAAGWRALLAADPGAEVLLDGGEARAELFEIDGSDYIGGVLLLFAGG
jgi:hypothetical protein